MSPATFARPRSAVTKLILICLIYCASIGLVPAQDYDQPARYGDITERPGTTTRRPGATDRPQVGDDYTTVTPMRTKSPKPTLAPTREMSTPRPTSKPALATTTPRPNVGIGVTAKRKFVAPLFQEIDPRQVWPWTINTVANPEDKKLWLIFKQKCKVDDFYREMNIHEADVEKYVRTIWARRIQMLKAKYKCTDYWEQPFKLSLSTIMPITDNCDNDKYMCANQFKGMWRKQYDSFLRSRRRTKYLVAYGQKGFNVYTLKKTIFILQRMRNVYNRCLNAPEVSLGDNFDGPIDGSDIF